MDDTNEDLPPNDCAPYMGGKVPRWDSIAMSFFAFVDQFRDRDINEMDPDGILPGTGLDLGLRQQALNSIQSHADVLSDVGWAPSQSMCCIAHLDRKRVWAIDGNHRLPTYTRCAHTSHDTHTHTHARTRMPPSQ